jgi:hypothetical protein
MSDHWHLLAEIIVPDTGSISELFSEAVFGLNLPEAFSAQVQAKLNESGTALWKEQKPANLHVSVFLRKDSRKNVGQLAWGFFLLELEKTETRHEIEVYLYADSDKPEGE